MCNHTLQALAVTEMLNSAEVHLDYHGVHYDYCS